MSNDHFLDSRTLLCALCGKPADQCRREQGRVAIAVSQPVPSNRVGNRVFLHGHEVFDTGPASELTPAGRTIRMDQAEWSRRVRVL